MWGQRRREGFDGRERLQVDGPGAQKETRNAVGDADECSVVGKWSDASIKRVA